MIDKKLIYLIHLLTKEKYITLSEKEKIDNEVNKLIKLLENFNYGDD